MGEGSLRRTAPKEQKMDNLSREKSYKQCTSRGKSIFSWHLQLVKPQNQANTVRQFVGN